MSDTYVFRFVNCTFNVSTTGDGEAFVERLNAILQASASTEEVEQGQTDNAPRVHGLSEDPNPDKESELVEANPEWTSGITGAVEEQDKRSVLEYADTKVQDDDVPW